MRFLLGLPLLIIPVAVYLILIFGTATPLDQGVLQFSLSPESTIVVSWGYFLIGIGLVLLYGEIVKATRTGSVSFSDHFLSTLLMVACIVLMVMMPEMATETFFILTLMTVIDVLGGFAVTLAGSRRDTTVQQQ